MKNAVMAVYRPKRNDIMVFVEGGGDHSSIALDLDEARAIHGAIGNALALAGCAASPLKAVTTSCPAPASPTEGRI